MTHLHGALPFRLYFVFAFGTQFSLQLPDQLKQFRHHIPRLACGYLWRLRTTRCHCFGELGFKSTPETIKCTSQSISSESPIFGQQSIEILYEFEHIVAVSASLLELAQRLDYIGRLDARK